MKPEIMKELQEKYNMPDSYFATRESDIQILTPDDETYMNVRKFMLENKIKFFTYISNVEGQDWFGKRFVEVPFMNDPYWEEIRATLKGLKS